MKIQPFNWDYGYQIATGGTDLSGASGSNSGFGGDVLGEPGALSVVGLRSTVSLSSNLGAGNSVGDVLALVSLSPPTAQFATPSNSGGGSLSVTDGSTTVSGVTALTFIGATVSGSTPNATATITGGGGGLAHSFAGYNTAGGSWEGMTGARTYCKQVTLAADSLVASIDAHVRGNTDNLAGYGVVLLQDNSGAPGVIVAGNGTGGGGAGGTFYLSNSGSMPTAARWLSVPLGAWVAAGTYWICVTLYNTLWDIAYDGSGSDQYFTASQALLTGTYPSAWAITTGTRKYSIRASILS